MEITVCHTKPFALKPALPPASNGQKCVSLLMPKTTLVILFMSFKKTVMKKQFLNFTTTKFLNAEANPYGLNFLGKATGAV